MSRSDLVSVIENAYDTESPEADWLLGLAQAARAHLDGGFGVVAWLFDARDLTRTRVERNAFAGDDPRVLEVMAQCSDILEREARDPRATAHRAGPCQTFSEVVPAANHHPAVRPLLDPIGAHDMLGVVGADPTGLGVGLGALLPAARAATRQEVRRWSRVVAHLAAGYRLRRTLAARPVHAVLRPDGRLEHAEDAAKTREAREALRHAARAVDRARGRLRREDGDEAVETWRGLVSGRWSLIDQFESDGRRYVVARENDPEAPFPPNLTQRERQVLIYRMLGHPSKLIAYELGLSQSTISMALSAALAKLGVASVTDVMRLLMPGGEA